MLWRSNSTDTDAGFALRRYIAASTTATQNDPEDSTADNPLELDSNADESDEAVDSVKYNPFQSASLDTDAGLASEANTVALTTLPNEELSSSQNSGVLRLAGGRGRLIQPFARPITKSFRVAVCDGVISEVREFLDDGVNPNAFSLEGYTPLWYAASLGLKDIVALLLSAGADPDLHSENPSYKPLFIAIKNQHVAVAHLLIDGGANIGVGPLRKRTALHQAVASEVLDIAKVLIDRGAEIDAVSDDVIIATPLCVAVWTCNSVLIDMLLDAGANPRVQTPDHKTALHVVAMKGSREVAAKIFAADKQRNPGPEQAILDMKDMNGLTALGLAICWNNVPVIDTLLHAGANPEDAKLFTDLHIASILGHPSIAAIPLDAVSQRDPDAEPEMKDGWGYTALHWAACNVRFEYVKLLLERGASTSSKSKSGRTPLQCAKGADAKGR